MERSLHKNRKALMSVVPRLLIGVALALPSTLWAAQPHFFVNTGTRIITQPDQLDRFEELGVDDAGLDDFYDPGHNFGGGVGFDPIPMLDLHARVDYSLLGLDSEALSDAMSDTLSATEQSVRSGGDLRALSLRMGVKFLPFMVESPWFIQPYFVGELGFANITTREMNYAITWQDREGNYSTNHRTKEETSETEFALALGGGVAFIVSPRVDVFVEAVRSRVDLSEQSFASLLVQVGVKIRLTDGTRERP